jgi:hypothetical protein
LALNGNIGVTAEQRDELAPSDVGHGGLLPRLMPTHQKAMALRGQFAANSAYHGGDGRSLGKPELF